MSGEPKPLTPQKCVWKRDPDGDSYVWVIGCTNEFSIQPDAEDYGYCPRCGQGIKLVTAPLEDHEGRWPEAAPSVPVVARDEAAELRAAAVEWAEADRAAKEAHKAWLSEAAKGGASYTGDKAISRSRKRWAESLPSFHTWVKASAEKHAAKERLEALARRLAGGENEK